MQKVEEVTGLVGDKPPLVEISPTGDVPVLSVDAENVLEKQLFSAADNLCVCFDVLYLVYKLYGYKSESESADELLKRSTVTTWMKTVDLLEFNWMKFMKHKLAAFYSYHLNQAIPDRDDEAFAQDNPRFLIGGKVGRWQRIFFRDANPQRSTSFLSSILLSKKGMPLPNEEDLAAGLEKTVKSLTSERAQAPKKILRPWGDLGDVPIEGTLSIDSVKNELRRTVKEIFGGAEFTDEDRFKPFFPSTSANYINNRAGAGAVGVIAENPELLKGLRVPGGTLAIGKYGKHRGLTKSVEEGSGVEDRRVGFPDEETREIRGEEEYVYEDTQLKENFKTLMKRVNEKAMKEPATVVAVALAEALKIRTISKGPPLTYTALRPLWKFMHDQLRKLKTFSLIGTPDTEEIILNILGKSLCDGYMFMSGDYKAATDNIHSWVSEHVAECISDELKLSDDERELFIRALTRHVFDTPEGPKEQKTGQLMGSIVSFPILCIINAAMCRWAMELAELKFKKLENCALGVNGDDCVLKSKLSVYSYWHDITSFVGLEESIGKTFQSKAFLNINSKTYLFNPDYHLIECERTGGGTVHRECPYEEVMYVNMGTLTGQARSGVIKISDQDDPRATLATRAKTLLQYCPEDLRDRVMREFLTRNRKILDSTGLPWFIPEWLGGLGLPDILPEYGNSEIDLRVATRILLNWRKKKPIHLAQGKSPWYVREYAQRALPSPFQTLEREDPTVQAWSNLTGKKTVDLIFDNRVEIQDIFDDGTDVDYDPETGQGSMELIHKPSKTSVNAAIRRNQSLWRPNGILPQPIPEEVLLRKTRYEGLRVTKLGSRPMAMAPQPPSVKSEVAKITHTHREFLTLD